MTHVAMLGDSIFDNGPYIGNAPDVRAQVETILSAAKVSSAARDGAVIANIGGQLRDVPPSATHILVSIGGNDAIGASGILQESASNVSEALEKIARVREDFDPGVFGGCGSGPSSWNVLRVDPCGVQRPACHYPTSSLL